MQMFVSLFGKLAGRAIYFAFVNLFFYSLFLLLWAKLSQYLVDRFSRSFHQMEGICLNFLDQVQFFRLLKGRCHSNQLCVVPDLFAWSRSISGSAGPIFTIFAPYGRYWIADERYVLLFPTALIALSLRNGMAYRLANTRSTNCATSCEKMVKIGSVVFELNWGRKWKLSCKSAKIGLYCRISQQLLNQALLMFQHL